MISHNVVATQLSEMERTLLRNIVAQGNAGDFESAAVASGYAVSGISSLKSRVTRKPAFLAALFLETQARFQDLAPAALATIDDIRTGKINKGAKVRLDAATRILDRAGHIAPRAKALNEGAEKTLAEMSLDELKATQDRLQAEILNRARPVNAQQMTGDSGEDVDLLG